MEAAAATTIAPASQRMRALRAANEVRTARAARKRSIGAGERDTVWRTLTAFVEVSE
jgi:hypothetical protein